jgi:hypothetical protein
MEKIKRTFFSKKHLKRDVGITIVAFLASITAVNAGNLESSGAPVATGYTLSDIYNRLTTNVAATEGGHSFSPSADPVSSFYTLSQIYGAIPTIDPTRVKLGTNYLGIAGTLVPSGGNTQPADVLSGKTFFGSGQSDWTLQTGTMTDVGQQAITPGTTNQTIAEGYHDGTGYSLGDPDLVSANIKGGVNVFGVVGGFSSQEKTATTEGEEVAPDSGNWLSKVTVAISNLISGNVKKSATVGGVVGTYSGYPGTGWEPNESGNGSVVLDQTNCENAANWKWFEDANGDGDTGDPEDGECIRTATANADSWNGAEQMTPNNLGTSAAPIAASGGSADSITVSGASWTADAYKNHIVKIKGGTAVNCWGLVKTNTADTITVYGSWLSTAYASSCGTPNGTSTFMVSDDWGQYDNSWIGDYSCAGDFPGGTVVHGSYPSSGVIALAVADCYDGRRDLLPDETDRSVISGTATAAGATSITDSSQSLGQNVWIGQKVLVTGGTGSGSYGFIESNSATQITVTDWLGGDNPGVGSDFKIIYIVPHSSYTPDAQVDGDSDDAKANNGPLMTEQLNNWQGTKLPSSSDFFGFCGYRNGGSDYENTAGSNSANKSYGNYGGQIGRTDEFMDLADNGSWEWLSEQHNSNNARIAGGNACSNITSNVVYSGYRFRSVFRP